MKARILDPIALGAITPDALRSYATFEGWKATEAYGEYSEIYNRLIGDRSVEIILPVTNQIGDYASTVAQLISVFSRENEQDELAVYRDLTHADRDVIRIRSPHADDDGSIAVNPGVELFAEARNILASAACSAQEPRPSYHVGKIQQVSEYLERVKLGQTESGSFVVTLLAPVPPLLEAPAQATFWPQISEEPYERQVTRFLANGLSSTRNALASYYRGRGITPFEEAVVNGVSANLCEAVAAIAEYGNGADVSVTWARTRPVPVERSRILFSQSDAEPLREVARLFRLREPRSDITLLGTVTRLHSDNPREWGDVTFGTFIDGKPRSVMALLPGDEHQRAIDAYRNNQTITIVGDLVFEGHRWYLRNARNLAVAVPES